MRWCPLLLPLAACGYEAYTPAPVDRFGSLYCSDPEGEASGEVVVVTVTPALPVRLTHYDGSCLADERRVVDLVTDLESAPGAVWEVADATTGGTLGIFEVPIDAVGAWSVAVPQ